MSQYFVVLFLFIEIYYSSMQAKMGILNKAIV